MDVKQLCQNYNPYFQDGCAFGDECKFTHLNPYSGKEYRKYCRTQHLNNPPDRMDNAYYRKHQYHYKSKQYNLSVQILQKLLKKYPFNASYHTAIAKCYDQLGMCQASVHHKKLISMFPTNPMLHLNYARHIFRHSYLRNGNKTDKISYGIVIFHASKALEFIKNSTTSYGSAKIHCFIGKLFDQKQVYNQAKYHYLKSLNFFDDPTVHNKYAKVCLNMMDLQSAAIHFEKSVAIKADHQYRIWHHFDYAKFLIQIGKYFEAEKHLTICLELNPNYDTILYVYGCLLCQCLYQHELGLSYLKRACDTKPDNIQYWTTYQNCIDQQTKISLQETQEIQEIPETCSNEVCSKYYVQIDIDM